MLKTFLITLILAFSIAHCYWIPPTRFGPVIRDLYSSSKADMIIMAQQWTIDSGLIDPNTTIGQFQGSPVLGGPGVFSQYGQLSRTYTDLPIHQTIVLEMRVLMTGNWKDQSDSFFLYIDNRMIKGFHIGTVGDQDSHGTGDLDARFLVRTFHSAPSITLWMSWELESANMTGSFAISDVSISFLSQQKSEISTLNLVDTALVSIPETNSKTGCLPNDYMDIGNVCGGCNEGCQECYGGPAAVNTMCFQCRWSYSLIDGGCRKCSPNCVICEGQGQNECLLCDVGYTLDFDGACVSDNTCNTAPYVIKYNDPESFKVCSETCDSGTFTLWNFTCSTSCDAPLIQETQDGISYCRYPCNKDNQEYLYPDGRCLNTCIYNPVNESGYLFCSYKCPDYLYQNDLCLPSCPAPYVIGVSDRGRTCYNPCEKRQYLHDNGTCSAECPSLYTVETQNGFSRCLYPCSRDQFLYSNGSCLSNCSSNFQLYIEGTNQLCINPCSPGQYLFNNGSCADTCPSNFEVSGKGRDRFCSFPCSEGEYLYSNGSCLLQCSLPYTARIEAGEQFCSNPCSSEEYLYEEGYCLTTCPENFRADIFGATREKFCSFPCGSDKYLYSNGSCLSSCSLPYSSQSDWLGRYDLCSPPCSNGEYYYSPSDTCVEACEANFTRVEDDILYCDQLLDNPDNNTNSTTGCNSIYEFKYPNGSCLSSCPYPRRADWHNQLYFCSPPCSNGSYYDASLDVCFEDCDVEFRRVEDDITYCENLPNPGNNNTNNTNSTQGCDSIYEFKYPNGSCLPSCPSPRQADWRGGSYFCSPPCLNSSYYYYASLDTCLEDCEVEFIRVEDDIIYCEAFPNPPNPSNNTNNTNATQGCDSIYEFKYPNGSCLTSCPSPRQADWHNGSYFCSPPCSNDSYYYAPLDTCFEDCEVEFIRVEDDVVYCEATPNLPNPGSNNTNSTNSTQGCESIYEFKYPNGSCLTNCTDPYTPVWNNGSNFCNPLCPSGQYYKSSNASCVDACESELIRVEGDIVYCEDNSSTPPSTNSTNGTYSVILEIYIRYNITLTNFNDVGGLEKFLQLLSALLGVDLSQIVITNIREGSTIIESQVKLTSDSDSKSVATTKSKVSAMSQKFQNAVESQALNLDGGVKVLNYSSSVVIPDVDQAQVESSSSSAVAIGVGVGLGIVAVAIVAFAVYKYKKNKLLRVREEAKRIEAYRVEVNRGIQVGENTENNLKNDHSVIFNNQGMNEQGEGGDQKAISLNEIMRKVDEGSKGQI